MDISGSGCSFKRVILSVIIDIVRTSRASISSARWPGHFLLSTIISASQLASCRQLKSSTSSQKSHCIFLSIDPPPPKKSPVQSMHHTVGVHDASPNDCILDIYQAVCPEVEPRPEVVIEGACCCLTLRVGLYVKEKRSNARIGLSGSVGSTHVLIIRGHLSDRVSVLGSLGQLARSLGLCESCQCSFRQV